jgi:hypothetical protein
MLELSEVLQIEPSTMYRKYEESTPVSDRPANQSTQPPRLDTSPIWTPIITAVYPVYSPTTKGSFPQA